MKKNSIQIDIDETYYLSEDNVVCKKGKTEAYIVNKETLKIYGPKYYKFGDNNKCYYFINKLKALSLINRLSKRRENEKLRRFYKKYEILSYKNK